MKAFDIGELVLLAALWGASFLFMRLGAHEFGPVVLAAVRVGLAANLEFPVELLEWMEDYREHADESAIRQPGIFEPAIEPPADATRSERFAAWTGRQPRVAYVPMRDHAATPSSAAAASAMPSASSA